LKVLLLTDGITPFVTGGMQKHSYMLVKYLAKQGVKIELHHCVYEGKLPNHNNLFELEEAQNIKVIAHCFPTSAKFPGHYVYRSYLYSKQLFENVKNRLGDFDFIYAKGFTGWKLMQEKEKGLTCPPIGVKFHGYEMYQKAPSFKVKLEHYLFRPFVKWNTLHADVVFSYGGKITDIISSLGVNIQNIIEVPSGIEEEFIRDEKELVTNNPITFCFIGRYERRKGVEELASALKSLVKKNFKFEFHFIGPIPKEKQLIDKRIIYHGLIRDVESKKAILDSCDVLVCPSHSEGMPNVILEAMARGLAVIATDVGAVKAMVSEKNGHILKPNKESIHEGISFLIALDKNRLNSLKKESLAKAKELHWDVVAFQLFKKIGEVIS